ncbi:haloacid dehalogenase type II [Marinomonas mediterranea]|jgi:2-haloalkanoic acid dehalogenase, type II|uniref:Haloacid dehalogenase, type II n=1 Tax=Marinomonas mediterranea (strain ATCC 700492 / JCM 21426 / NBRC 103028 / MMB-1) TaxID=717774 RepID=F2JVR0_MARM1|nr:haloacid dehalogenase type II [Marinomonas mediterranea]ADZ91696.1 haloacid dehalogenase, type II [Marinomonas mediterranea MMB-1]WCN09647.1 haloacid dehalogenase type II [Marinomonas mediterranea]WCN13736.1 haloacid dehalogenase type II [Marinomonas mediterranea]WCN17792.1 haloacid dehalogenase type II [Marinomonas mediterranea MMB-1]
MSELNPKYITFDCYGTLINFQMGPTARRVFEDRIRPEDMDQFVKDFSAYRLDEVLGDWKPYDQIVCNAVQRTCKRWGIEYRDDEGMIFYNAVPTWGPHPDVPEALARLATKYKLVALTNAMDVQIPHNIEKLGAPFHAVYTAQQAQSYKPRMKGFEYMLEQLGCGPEDLLHVSSSLRYDLMTAHDMGIKNKVFVNRGHEPSTPFYGYHEVKDLAGLADLLGV